MDRETIVILHMGIIMMTAAVLLLKKKKRWNRRRWWTRPILRDRFKKGHYDNLFKKIKATDAEEFFNYTRMTVDQFDKLLQLIKPLLIKKSKRKAFAPEQRLAMTLKFLAQGGTMKSIAQEYYVGKSSASKVIKETCMAIWKILSPLYLAKPTKEEWHDIAEGYWQNMNLPNCVGSIDGKHVTIQAPNNSGANYMNTNSVILLASCDWNYCFTLVDIGAYDSQNEGGIFSTSNLGQSIEKGHLQLPDDTELPGSQITMSYFFVGDVVFPLKPYLMRPFPGKFLDDKKRVFNNRIYRVRQTIENAFGVLAARWHIFRSTIIGNPDTVGMIIMGTVCLHNFLKKEEQHVPEEHRFYCPRQYLDEYTEDGGIIPGQWRNEIERNTCINDVGRLGANCSQRSTYELRNRLSDYFMSPEGEVQWQYRQKMSSALEEAE